MAIKPVLHLFLLTLLLSSCASPRPWTKREKAAAGFFVLGHTADAITTERMLDRGHYETNDILGKYPSDTEIAIYFPVTGLIGLGVAHWWPEAREWILWSGGTLGAGLAIHNEGLE